MAELSIEETNKLRAALGMTLLPTANGTSALNFKSASPSGDDEEEAGSTLDSRQAAAGDNWRKLQDEAAEKKRREARRDALKKERDAAQRFAKLEGKGLGDAGEYDLDTRSWLLGTNKRQKKIAKNRTKQYERELLEREQQAQYTDKDLAGKKVGHELTEFDEGDEQILTLKDAEIGEDSDEDELENVTLRDKEKLKERLELKKKRPVYDPNAVDETGDHSVLAHYDEEIDGKKRKRFTLDGQGSTTEGAAASSNASGHAQGQKFSLDFFIDDKPASDYLDASEVKIKKPKKKKEKSKRQKVVDDDDIFPAYEGPAETNGAEEAMEVDGAETKPTITATRKRNREDASFVDDEDLQSHLALQRRAALKKRKLARPEDIARQLRDEQSATPDVLNFVENAEEEGGLVIDETSEFVANLQKPQAPQPRHSRSKKSTEEPKTPASVPLSPSADDEGDIDMQQTYSGIEDEEDLKARLRREASSAAAAESMTATGLEEETSLDQGLGSTLNMLTQRGLLKTGASGDLNALNRDRQRFLQEKSRREEDAERKARTQRERDRASGKFERMTAREREQYAQWENKQRDQYESRQMADVFNREYKPNVELTYVDEFGRHMNQREAFKQLSHQFHGKGSGKQKTEKRLKKIEDEKKRAAQSSLDSSQSTGMNSAMGTQARKNRQAGVRLQ